MFRPLRNVLRLLGIARTLARYDALFPADWLPATGGLVFMARLLSGFRTAPDIRGLRDGERLARALQALGPSFIKFGQMLSTRADLVGETIAADLSTLQDQLPAFTSAQARAAIEAEFETSVEALFVEFEETPVAAASIAQVHIGKVRVQDETPEIRRKTGLTTNSGMLQSKFFARASSAPSSAIWNCSAGSRRPRNGPSRAYAG